jgi:hypothetical protein
MFWRRGLTYHMRAHLIAITVSLKHEKNIEEQGEVSMPRATYRACAPHLVPVSWQICPLYPFSLFSTASDTSLTVSS